MYIFLSLQVPCFAMEYFLNGVSEGLKIGIGLDMKKTRSQAAKKPEDKKQEAPKAKGPVHQYKQEKSSYCNPIKKLPHFDDVHRPHVRFTPAELQEIDRRIKEAELFNVIDK